MKKKHAQRIREHLLGPTGSVILHVLVVIALFKLVLFRTPTKDRAVEVTMMEMESIDLDQFREQLKELEQIQVVDAVEIPEVLLEEPAMGEVEAFEAEVPEVDFAALDMLDDVQSPLVMSGLYAARSDAGRRDALQKYGRGVAKYTEASVLKALEWLKEHQRDDGSWDEKGGAHRTAMTGLALLTFLAHGETPTSEHYGATVERAIRYLVGSQGADGAFCAINQHGAYAHAIATYAVSEAYGLTRIPILRETMEKGAAVIIEGQQPGGGWDYGYKKGTRRDTSLAGWQIQALKAARIADAKVHGIEQALEKAAQDMESAQAPNGRFAYTNLDSARTSLSGVGVLCLQLLGRGDGSVCRKGLAVMEDQEVDWNEAKGWALYTWYYMTQAKFHHGGRAWSKWNNEFARLYARMQNEDGSWTSPAATEQKYGAVYGTTLAALTLQVYYRLLPTYQTKAVAVGAEEDDEEEDDLIQVL